MSEHDPNSAERLVITAGEIAEATSPRVHPSAPPPRLAVPWWGMALGCILVLCLPLLCAMTIAVRVTLRHRERQRAVWTSFLCTCLIVSGLLTSVSAAYLWSLKTPAIQEAAQLPLGLVSHDLAGSFPSLPAAAPMTSVDIAARSKLLVFIVMPDPGTPLGKASLDYSPLGAATLLMADDSGYLLGTNRHVTDARIPLLKKQTDRELIVSSEGSYAYAEVVARHQHLDLALMWVPRRTGHGRFRQPITRYADISVGSAVYVIGHPQRLFFTLSSGLVSRLGGDGTVQLSAPISPGNSGGPVYDSLGNLLGLVTYAFDKQMTPNAENLNFATRADAFLSATAWTYRGDGKAILHKFLNFDPNRED